MSEASRSAAARAQAVDDDASSDDERWHDLVSQVGAEIAAPLTAALERIHVLTATGKIDRAGLRALRDEVEQARQIGMIGQQLTRFASGRVRQSHEVLQLEEVMKSVLALRSRETQARGIALKPLLNKLPKGALEGSLISADALHCQQESARFITQELGADYLFGLKGNQSGILERAQLKLPQPFFFR